MIVNSKVLSVVVPITKMAGNLENLATWLLEIDPGIFEVFIIHALVQQEIAHAFRLTTTTATIHKQEIKIIIPDRHDGIIDRNTAVFP
jgi:hypothetical protein